MDSHEIKPEKMTISLQTKEYYVDISIVCVCVCVYIRMGHRIYKCNVFL